MYHQPPNLTSDKGELTIDRMMVYFSTDDEITPLDYGNIAGRDNGDDGGGGHGSAEPCPYERYP